MNTKRLILALLLLALLSVMFLEAFDIPGGCYASWHVKLIGYANKRHSTHKPITRTLDVQAPENQVSRIALRIARTRWPGRSWEIVSIIPTP